MTMKRTTLILVVLVALCLPGLAHAQYWPSKVGGQTAEESLTAQEREMLAWAREFRDKCSAVLEKWIGSAEISEDRLFAYLYYPIPHTDPPKFNTDWDRLADRDIQAIEEAILSKSSTISFAVMVDKFGYLPTHNLRYSQPLTGNTATDLVNNRTKRIFNDRTGLSAARNEASFLIQQYQRDTGEVMFDISVPILVKGKRWGAVRIGYRPVDVR
jgi:methyl-accepting chemotaxis protein